MTKIVVRGTNEHLGTQIKVPENTLLCNVIGEIADKLVITSNGTLDLKKNNFIVPGYPDLGPNDLMDKIINFSNGKIITIEFKKVNKKFNI